MKKLVYSFFATFFVLIFIWYVMGFIRYGNDLYDMHLDFKSSLSNLTNLFEFNVNDILESLGEFSSFIKAWSSDGTNFMARLEATFDVLIVTPINLSFDILHLIFDVIVSVFKFIFLPSFI